MTITPPLTLNTCQRWFEEKYRGKLKANVRYYFSTTAALKRSRHFFAHGVQFSVVGDAPGVFFPLRRAWVEFTRDVHVYKEMLSSASQRLNEVSPPGVVVDSGWMWHMVPIAPRDWQPGHRFVAFLGAGTSPPYSASRDGSGRCCSSVRPPSIWSWHRSLIWLINRALNLFYWSDRKRCCMRWKRGELFNVRFQRLPRVTRLAEN